MTVVFSVEGSRWYLPIKQIINTETRVTHIINNECKPNCKKKLLKSWLAARAMTTANISAMITVRRIDCGKHISGKKPRVFVIGTDIINLSARLFLLDLAVFEQILLMLGFTHSLLKTHQLNRYTAH
jgi:hypothetical protein